MTKKDVPFYAIVIMDKYSIPSEDMEEVWKVVNKTSTIAIRELMAEKERQIVYMSMVRSLGVDGDDFDGVAFMEKYNITAEELLKAWCELDQVDIPMVIRMVEACDINVELLKQKLLHEYPWLGSEGWLIRLCFHKMSCELLRFHSKFDSIIAYYDEVMNGKKE